MKSTGMKFSSFSHGNGFPVRLREALWFFEESESESDDRFYSEFYAPEAQWLIKRTPCYGFAAKGGNNAEHHNHNDIGHFIFAKDSKQILCDLGSAPYVRDYFGPKRYTFLETNSRGHSVPIIDGEFQKGGKEFAARDTKYENGVFSLDISGAYENLDASEKIVRSFEFGDNFVKLTDKFAFSNKHSVVERLVSRIDPDISTRGTVYVGDVKITYDAETWQVSKSSETLSNSEKICYMIDFKPLADTDEFVVMIGE
jgi:hypothetical protein